MTLEKANNQNYHRSNMIKNSNIILEYKNANN